VRKLVHVALCAALALVLLPDLPVKFEFFLDHLARDGRRPKQIEEFQQKIRGAPG
jgi:hypothetical protein